jgi:hypothetical protein
MHKIIAALTALAALVAGWRHASDRLADYAEMMEGLD